MRHVSPVRRPPHRPACLALVLVFALTLPAVNGQVEPPLYVGIDYEPPAPGTYGLAELGPAADGIVITGSGEHASLHALMQDKITLLSFIFTHCSDQNGCPLATAALYNIYDRARRDPNLSDRFQILSLSFDPVFDTPAVMARYGAGFAAGNTWRFLTTRSAHALQPILDGYGQHVIRDVDERGHPLPSFSHILRVVLIDANQRIRFVYSVPYLHPELIINDIKTLLIASEDAPRAVADGQPPPLQSSPPNRRPPDNIEVRGTSEATHWTGPGDVKIGYSEATYHTQARAVDRRQGAPTDLLAFARTAQLGLPRITSPDRNHLTPESIALGRALFFDRRLSLNATVSCAMCHIPEQGFTSNEMQTAVGFEGRTVRRNTPTLYNVGYATRLFHDAREDRLEQQAWSPLLADNEMANPSIGVVLNTIRELPGYRAAFREAFGERGVSMETVGMALAAYQRTLIAADTPFDRWRFGGEEAAINAAAKRGFELFTGRAGCAGCHIITDRDALFTDYKVHNTGIGYRAAMEVGPGTRRVTLAPGVVVSVDQEIVASVSEPAAADVGRYEVTQDPRDRWKYKTPTLRNIRLTAPYMHDGSLANLREVVEFYNEGGIDNPLLEPRIRPLNLTRREIDDIIAFLSTLTSPHVPTLVSDAFAAPIGDTRDPAAKEKVAPARD